MVYMCSMIGGDKNYIQNFGGKAFGKWPH